MASKHSTTRETSSSPDIDAMYDLIDAIYDSIEKLPFNPREGPDIDESPGPPLWTERGTRIFMDNLVTLAAEGTYDIGQPRGPLPGHIC